jgi:hypothetical protein
VIVRYVSAYIAVNEETLDLIAKEKNKAIPVTGREGP